MMANIRRSCEHEAAVRDMARSKADAPGLRDHAAACAACRETLAVTAWMQRLAAAPIDAPPLPDPMHIWLKAEMLRRWDAQRKAAVTPLEVGDRIQMGMGLAGAAALLLWLWSRLNAQPAAALPSPVTLMLVVSVVLLAGAVSIFARGLLSRG
jgi:heme A synthase